MPDWLIVRCREISRLNLECGKFRAQASNVSIGSGSYEGQGGEDDQKVVASVPPSDSSSEMWVIWDWLILKMLEDCNFQ